MKLVSNRWTAVVAGLALAALPLVAAAQEEGGTKTARELRIDYDKSLQGKTIAYLPIALGVPLSDEWGRVVQEEAEWRGMKYIVRDPNNNPSAMQQALTALVDQKPDVLIVQNPSVTLLMKDLKRAESQGTHVIELQVRRLRRRRLARDRQDARDRCRQAMRHWLGEVRQGADRSG
jgi:ribose transport system substrate-binding protein